MAIHKKTGNIYDITGFAINCTNKNTDEIMVVYSKNELVFVREINEFNNKFESSFIFDILDLMYMIKKIEKQKIYDIELLDRIAELILKVNNSSVSNKHIPFCNSLCKEEIKNMFDNKVLTRSQIIETIIRKLGI